jgi:hypothetical protein
MMNPALLTRGGREPDLDMMRVRARPTGGILRRLIGSVFRNPQPQHSIDTPCRSVDREQQQYSADYG